MAIVTYKSKQFFWQALKLFSVVGCFYIIYHQLTSNEALQLQDFNQILISNSNLTLQAGFILLALSVVSWFFEIYKWKTLTLKPFLEAAKESLASLSFSLVTPNRIGEYGAKALYYPAKQRSLIVTKNFIGNAYQLLSTLLIGCLGFVYFIGQTNFTIEFNLYKLAMLVGILIAFGLLIKQVSFLKKWRLQLKTDFKKIDRSIHLRVAFLSFAKYLVFSHQFYLLLLLFEIDLGYINAMSTISSMYLLASLVPMFSFLDVVLKSSVAVLLFSLWQVPSLEIISITLMMWLLNFALPAMIGTYYVFTFRPIYKT